MSRVIELGMNSDITDDGQSGLDADARAPKADSCELGALPEHLRPRAERYSAFDGLAGMILKIGRCVKQGMDCIANDFIDHSAMRRDDGRHALKIAVESSHEDCRTGVARHCGKPFNVGEQRG